MTTTKNKADEVASATYKALADQVIEAMESDPGHWSKSWVTQAEQGFPINATTGKHYTGGNVMWFIAQAWAASYPTNQWATFKQWKSVGYSVLKGEKSTVGIVWKPIVKEDPDTIVDGKPAKRTFWLKRSFRVFNRAQVAPIEGETQKPLHGEPELLGDDYNKNDRIDHAEEFFSNLNMTVRLGNPAYAPGIDVVYMPEIGSFDSPEDFYATQAHEATHWTGHKSRKDRERHAIWGDETYAFEELIAELGAVFLSAGHLGITVEPRPDHAQYLAHWIKRIKEDPEAIWKAAAKAEQAVRFMVEMQEPVATVMATMNNQEVW